MVPCSRTRPSSTDRETSRTVGTFRRPFSQYLKAGVPAEKLSLGLGTYGRTWTQASSDASMGQLTNQVPLVHARWSRAHSHTMRSCKTLWVVLAMTGPPFRHLPNIAIMDSLALIIPRRSQIRCVGLEAWAWVGSWFGTQTMMTTFPSSRVLRMIRMQTFQDLVVDLLCHPATDQEAKVPSNI